MATHYLAQHGRPFRSLDMSDSNALSLLRKEFPKKVRADCGITLVKGEHKRIHKTGEKVAR